MIALASHCLLFELAGGERVPFAADMVSTDLMGETVRWLDLEFVNHAVAAVFHWFKHDLGRQTVTVAEFAEALEKVLRGLRLEPPLPDRPASALSSAVSDLGELVRASGEGCELLFFPRLRDELRRQLLQGPRVLRFNGLRRCVKHLVGARRWSARCQSLEEQIVAYLRECLGAEAKPAEFALVVE